MPSTAVKVTEGFSQTVGFDRVHSSLCTVAGENAGRHTAMYSAPSDPDCCSDPLAGMRHHGLARADVEHAGFMLHAQNGRSARP
jgi:hypothetical protein